eukprot:1946656-Pleurochrysis_carterae.AAC.1
MAWTLARQGPQKQATSRAYQERSREKREAPPGGKSANLFGYDSWTDRQSEYRSQRHRDGLHHGQRHRRGRRRPNRRSR